MDTKIKEASCIWTPLHLEEINKAFPEVLTFKNTEELLMNVGKRTVVQYIRDKVTRGVDGNSTNKSRVPRLDN